ncbi:hypothetical protein [Devosia sp. LjRoot3]|uniref:hypothetical protein n=1 Tax=Devosia sp. LjRoot3 TaxID=3342319 RepID=UPI003ECF0748
MHVFKTITLAALMVAGAAPVFAEDAMAPAMDAMAPQAMISDADLELCLTQAAAITFEEAMTAATVACNGLHEGMDVMGAIRSLGMDEKMEANPIAGGAMAPAM